MHKEISQETKLSWPCGHKRCLGWKCQMNPQPKKSSPQPGSPPIWGTTESSALKREQKRNPGPTGIHLQHKIEPLWCQSLVKTRWGWDFSGSAGELADNRLVFEVTRSPFPSGSTGGEFLPVLQPSHLISMLNSLPGFRGFNQKRLLGWNKEEMKHSRR